MGYQDMSDAELMGGIRKVDSGSDPHPSSIEPFARELYRRYYQQAYNLSRYYGLPRHEAEEAVQEAFISLFRGSGRYDTSREFKPYFFKIVMNEVRDRWNDMKKNRYRDIDQLEDMPDEKKEDFLNELHIRDHMTGIISKMPEKLRSVLVLRVYGEMEFEAISSMLGVGIRQLHNRLNEAYDYLRAEVEVEK